MTVEEYLKELSFRAPVRFMAGGIERVAALTDVYPIEQMATLSRLDGSAVDVSFGDIVVPTTDSEEAPAVEDLPPIATPPVYGSKCDAGLSWEDYCDLSSGGIENPVRIGEVYTKLTGEQPGSKPALEVFKTVLEAVRKVTDGFGKAIKGTDNA